MRMLRFSVVFVLIVVISAFAEGVVFSAGAPSGSGSGGGRSGSSYRGGGHYDGHYGGYYRGYRGYRGGYYWGGYGGVVIGAPYWGASWYSPYYNPYYYPYAPAVTVPSMPQEYIKQSDDESSSRSSGVWYFCPESKAYYPYVRECSGGWQTVPAQPPSESGR